MPLVCRHEFRVGIGVVRSSPVWDLTQYTTSWILSFLIIGRPEALEKPNSMIPRLGPQFKSVALEDSTYRSN